EQVNAAGLVEQGKYDPSRLIEDAPSATGGLASAMMDALMKKALPPAILALTLLTGCAMKPNGSGVVNVGFQAMWQMNGGEGSGISTTGPALPRTPAAVE